MPIVELSATVKPAWKTIKGLKMQLHDSQENVLDVLDATVKDEKWIIATTRKAYRPWIRYALILDAAGQQLIVAHLAPGPNTPGQQVRVAIPDSLKPPKKPMMRRA